MKKNLLLASLMLAAGTFVSAQSSRSLTPVSLGSIARPDAATSRTMTCTADTLRYALIKEYTINPTALTFFAAPLNGPGEEQSQAFISPGTVNVVGVNFRARINSANASAIIPTMVYLYSVNASFQPIARIDSALVTVSTTTVKYYNANFLVPRVVTGNYAVAIRPTTAFRMDFILNDRDAGTGGEALSFNKWNPGTGSAWFPNADATNGWGQDFDVDISPVVSYTIAADYTVSSPSPSCISTALTFTNTTTPMNTLSSRMYNYNVFMDYFGGAAIADSTYAWDMDNGSPIMWSTNASYTYPAAGTYDVSLYTLAGFWNSCVDTKMSSITIAPVPVLSVTSPSAVCSPATVDVTAAAVTAGSTGSGTLTYWTDAGATTTLSSPSAVTVSGTYYIQSSTAPGCTDLEPVMVTVNTTPVLSITSPAPVCAPATVDLTAAAVTAGSIGSGTLSYFTDAGATSALGSPSTVAAGGTYYIQSANGSCSDIEPVMVTINPMEDATITQPAMVCDDDAAFNLTAMTAGGTWSGTGITSASAGTFDPTTAGAGSHTIMYMTSGACPGVDTVIVTVSICTGIQNADNASVLSVYPNPSTGVFTVDLGRNTNSVMEVYSVVGAKIIAEQFNTQIATLDLNGLNAGVYFLKVTTDNGQITKQITLTK